MTVNPMNEALQPSQAREVVPTPYLATLNQAQRLAVETVEGPLLVLAGAGTGKTRVLTTRFAHILASGRAWPWEVLAVTFTNKAAAEMRERIARLLGRPAEGLWLGTFHALCARMLRRHAELVGLGTQFTILDTDDQLRLLKQVIEAANIDATRWPARGLLAIIQRWKDRGLTPDAVRHEPGTDFADGRALDLYRTYQERLRTLNAVDFGDLLMLCLRLLTEHPDVASEYQRQFRYILVDEYQDTNVAQYLWLRLLAQGHHNICCVGDDDQSIYGWRGAEVGNILRFEKDFPAAQVVRLEQNYRSTGHILAAASGLIAHNRGRLGKTLWTDGEFGDKVRLRAVWDGEEEARAVCEEIEVGHRRGHAYGGYAILVRTGFQTREFEDRLMTVGIPYRVVGGLRFYERQEIRDALAYLRVIVQPDDDLAFERIVNVPKRGLGAATMQTLHALGRAQSISLVAAARRLCETDELRPKVRSELSRLIGSFDRWRGALGSMPHVALVEMVLDRSGYTAMWQADRSIEAQGRLDNLKEFVAAVAEFETLPGFLEHVALVTEAVERDGGDAVTVMTLHAAKGLEFDTVFLPGWEDELFPHVRALEENGNAGLEEERRLAYVGLTRARKRAHVLYAANRRIYNQWRNCLPSRFIEELPGEHVEIESAPGLYQGQGGQAFSGRARGPSQASWQMVRAASPAERAKPREITLKPEPAPAARFARNDRVFHQKFGYGRVMAVDGNKLEISFEKAGVKKVIDSFVEKA
ncbi:MAG: UvrD-helicase domain-containing protein [Alphaproteobacteria bacterium]